MPAAPLALVGPTASARPRRRRAGRRAGGEIVSIDSMLVYRGMDVGTAKPTHADRARVPHHLIDVAEPSEAFTVARFQAAGRGARDRPGAGSGAAGRRVRPVLPRGRGRPGVPGTDPAHGRARAPRTRLGTEGLYARLDGHRPGGRRGIEPANMLRIVRALEVPAVTGRPVLERSLKRGALRRRGGPCRRPPDVPRAARRPDPARVVRMLDEGWLDEVRALVDAGFGGWLPPRRPSATLSWRVTSRGHDVRRCRRGDRQADDQPREAAEAWFRRDPRIRWFDVTGGARVGLRAIRLLASLGGRSPTAPIREDQGTGNDFVMLVDLDDERPLEPDVVAAICQSPDGVGADGVDPGRALAAT